MNINNTNIDKRIRTDKYVHEHHAYGKNKAWYVNVGPFHNRYGVIVSWENMWMNSYVQMCKVL